MWDFNIISGTVEELWTGDPDYAGVKIRSINGRIHSFMLWGPNIESHDYISPLQDGIKISLLRDAFISGAIVKFLYYPGTNYPFVVQIIKNT